MQLLTHINTLLSSSHRVYLGRVLIVQQQQMQMLQILSLWTPACPVRTAAPARETPSARSALPVIHLFIFLLKACSCQVI